MRSSNRAGPAIQSRPVGAGRLPEPEARAPGAAMAPEPSHSHDPMSDWPTTRLARISRPRRLTTSGRLVRVRWQRAARLMQRQGRLRVVLLIALCLAVLLTATGAGAGIVLGARAVQLAVSLHSAQVHLQDARIAGSQLAASPLDHATLLRLRADLVATEQDLAGVRSAAAGLGVAGAIPGAASRMSDGLVLAEMGSELVAAGREALDATIPIVDAISPVAQGSATGTTAGTSPAASTSSAPTLTAAQIDHARAVLVDVRARFTRALALRRAVHDPAGLGAQVAGVLAAFDRAAPFVPQALDDADVVLRAAPEFLGVDRPAAYLLELLDSAELRAGGGFIGNYGIVTITGGRVQSAFVRDTYLLDNGARHTVEFPPEYSWFNLAPAMGLRDSNLSPDFTVNAQVAEHIYSEETGDQVDGVIAITPAFIARLLVLTGPIQVPGYDETVTSANLADKIHFYQAHPDAGPPVPAGTDTSTRKRFTSVLGEAVFARLRALPSSQLHGAITAAREALASKDLQIYVNDTGVYALLTRAHMASTLPAVAGDALTLVDNNVGINKASQYVTETADDTVVIAQDGSTTHTLTLRYAYNPHDDPYDPAGVTGFFDVVQVYVPKGSTLLRHSGLEFALAPRHLETRDVFGGGIGLAPHYSRTVTLAWSTPAPTATLASAAAAEYSLLLTRQPGATYALTLTIQPPETLCPLPSGSPLVLVDDQVTYHAAPQPSDVTLTIGWHGSDAKHPCAAK